MKAKDKFFSALEAKKMIEPGCRVLVAVSGGADSVCLLSLFAENADRLGIFVGAAHLHHGIRGEEADRDAGFVRMLCDRLGIPLHLRYADVPGEAARTGESEELCGRRLRYDFFRSLGYDRIATAHTGSDRIETMLMNLSRGSSLHGLCSIPPVRGNIIRPLLDCTRDEILDYCKENSLSWAEDTTNATPDYTRNRFRLRILPQLVSENPAFESNALRCLRSLNLDDSFLTEQTEAVLNRFTTQDGAALDVAAMSGVHPALRLRAIAAFAAHVPGSDAEERHLRLLDENACADCYSLDLPGGVIARIDRGMLRIARREPAELEAPPEEIILDLHNPSDCLFGGVCLRLQVRDGPPPEKNNGNYLDFSKIDGIIKVRTRTEGDRVSLAHRGCTKTLKKLFSESGIPPHKRKTIPVVADSRGVIWVAGFGGDASRLAGPQTKKMLIIRTENGNNDE